jgi:hypothetical protein
MPEPHLRAGDTDREAVASALGTHMAAGRLNLAEFDERLARAYAARTFGELAELTADLPALAPRPVAAVPRPVAPPPAPWAWHGHAEHSWRAWLTTSGTVLAIYLAISIASWDLSYFWPIWVIGPWGAALLAQRIGGHGACSRGERPQSCR